MKKFKIKTRPEKSEDCIGNGKAGIFVSNEMKKLIKEAYEIFFYDLNGKLSVCTPCCVSSENVKKLLEIPVNRLSRELIWEYLDAVHYDETGFEIKHFLPKILEFTAQNENIRMDVSLNLDKCYFEKKNVWSKNELDFMYRFSKQLISDFLDINPDT
ncbi:hypothetical protein EII29_05990 [Leptotrichia sp. OH3620_COT-345]|uniref:hypothetical protein n=1 Tax=Leptotrichia sp. OH3620_COT-345 TaxID=2491048 RepID=UPI000F64D811|nr:hypothetical protein [Leptotrichia sp. OH3620_COT-345]RRD39590.1 hypothetical protein EII29_05990 [Leptotrichia sp. OH3620_COT-345]